MCDIDHFKHVNDGYGHQAGDEVLSDFGGRLSDGLRLGHDWLARVGGEEFALVLPDTDADEGVRIAERLRERIGTRSFTTASGPIHITAIFGVCALPLARRSEGAVAVALVKA